MGGRLAHRIITTLGFTRITLPPAAPLVCFLSPLLLGCSQASPILPPTFLPGSRNLQDQIPGLPGTRHQAAICQLLHWAPWETSTPRRGYPLASVTHSWACSAVGLPPRPEPGALVSPGHGEAWLLGPTQEASLASDLRHRPQGQTISSLSLALQKSGLGAGGERADLGRGQGLQVLCC